MTLISRMILTAAIGLCGFTAFAGEELTVDQIVDNALRANYYRGTDGRAKVTMTITDNQNRTRTREFVILRRNDLPAGASAEAAAAFIGDQKFYVYFSKPADVRKMVFLVWKHTATDDDRWLYLPALDLVKRIASSEKRTSFVGSHFFYEDVSGRNKDEDNHELVETTDNYYVLKNTPKNPDQVEFAWNKMWIHRKTFLVTQVDYYDRNNENYRQYKALKVETVQDIPTVTKASMSDSRIGGNTVIDYADVRYNAGLPDDIFTERYLRNPPNEYLK